MPTKQLERLLFAQGGLCFFCKKVLPAAESSVEHLVASANGGSNNDQNCVACCKAVNMLLGSMSLKEKIQVVMNQKGQFKCPVPALPATPEATPKPASVQHTLADTDAYNLVLKNLKSRGNSRPRKLKTLSSTIRSLFPKGLQQPQLDALLKQLTTAGKIHITDDSVTYSL